MSAEFMKAIMIKPDANGEDALEYTKEVRNNEDCNPHEDRFWKTVCSALTSV